MENTTPILSVKKLSKSFPGVKALTGVDFSLRAGEVHALMGENGAGKSTLIKVITGVYKHDNGEIFLEGNSINPSSVRHSQELGISTVYQEVNLVPMLSVAENIFLGRNPSKSGIIHWRKINKKAQDAVKKLGLDIDVTMQLASYPIAIQQLVAIARALDLSAKVLILDEPTSSLDNDEVKILFNVMKKLKKEGMAILFVSHFIDQIYEISDRITVLRNGELIGEYETEKLSRIDLVSKMMGKELIEVEKSKSYSENTNSESGKNVFMSMKDVYKKGYITLPELKLNKGEVLGFAGLLGSGRSELAKLIFGIETPSKGEIEINGKKISVSSPRKAIANGMSFCPEDRKTSGIVEGLTVRENMILSIQAKKGWLKPIPRKTAEKLADEYIKMLNISTPHREQKIKNLSGGNQQKVIIARSLALNPDLLILDEPTRGIDVGAKAEILKLILSLSKKGMSIIFISSELAEIVKCAARVVVLRDKKKVTELTNDNVREEVIMKAIAEGSI